MRYKDLDKAIEKIPEPYFSELEKFEFIEPEYIPPKVNFLIFDDMQGDKCFKGTGSRSKLNKMLISNRHLGLNVVMCFQSYKAVPKVIRAQLDVYAIGRINDDKLVEEIYYEVAGNELKKDEFVNMFEDIHRDPYRFLVIDYSQPVDRQYSDSFERVVDYKKYVKDNNNKKNEDPITDRHEQ